MNKHLLAAIAALSLAAPVAAQAQVIPSYAAQASYANSEEDVHGRVVGFDGAYTLTVRDERGFIDNVQLHDGTIINPTGLTLAPGMIVNILGYDAGDYLAANEIDTPYTFYDGDAYYGGHLWSYWGPSINLAFFFGNVGWWHGADFDGAYAWNGGVRVYNNVTYKTVHRDVDKRPVPIPVDRRPVPIPVDRPPTYHRPNPIPVDNPPAYHRPNPIPVDNPPSNHRVVPVVERPVPLANSGDRRPSFQSQANRGNANGNGAGNGRQAPAQSHEAKATQDKRDR